MKPIDLGPNEYNPYFKKYIDLVENLPLLQAMAVGMTETNYFFDNLPTEKWDYRYAEGKWTPKDILLHLMDTERVFGYRALYFARDKNPELKGFDENVFAENANAKNRNTEDLLNEYIAVRTASIALFKGFTDNMLRMTGIASNSNLSVRAAGFIICGHEIHHCNIIKERYLFI